MTLKKLVLQNIRKQLEKLVQSYNLSDKCLKPRNISTWKNNQKVKKNHEVAIMCYLPHAVTSLLNTPDLL